MSMRMGDKFPNLTGPTQSINDFDLYKYLGDSWGLLLFYPHDGHGVGTTDLGAAALRQRQFEERGVRVCGLTVGDSIEAHQQYVTELLQWLEPRHLRRRSGSVGRSSSLLGSTTTGGGNNSASINNSIFPLLLLPPTHANALGVLNLTSSSASMQSLSQQSPTQSKQKQQHQVHSVTLILKPDKTIVSVLWYPSTSGRMYEELIRLLDSMQLYLNMTVATPADWHSGQPVLVDDNVTDEQAKDLFGEEGLMSGSQSDWDVTMDVAMTTATDGPTPTSEAATAAANNATTTDSTVKAVDLPYLRWTKDPTWFAPEG